MNRPIQRPFLERRNHNAQPQKQGRSTGTNVFGANTLVFLTGGGILAACATGATSVYGWSHAASLQVQAQNSGGVPLLYQNLYPFDLRDDAYLVMSTTNNAGDSGNTGTAASAPALSTVVIGQTYGLLNPTTGPNAGIQQVNLQDTTNGLLTVVDLYPNQATTDQNGLVLVRIAASAFQG